MENCSLCPAKRRRLEPLSNLVAHPKVEWNLLSFDLQLRILTWLEIEDLFRSCLLVCKQWKDGILCSDSFARLQYRQSSLWGSLRPTYSHQKLVFENGSNKFLNVGLAYSEKIECLDRGIVCIRRLWEQMRVGNPIKDVWKVIPAPSEPFLPKCMSVDTSKSPASFKIVAISFEEGMDWRRPSMFHTEIYDSEMGAWSKRSAIPLDGPFQDKLEGSLVMALCSQQKRIVNYDFEQDRWSIKSYVSPEKENAKEQVIFCEEEPILVTHLWPWLTIWKEHPCCKGVIKWHSMAKLDIKAFLVQHTIEFQQEGLLYLCYCTGHVINIRVDLSWEKTALLNYDMRKGHWKFGALMERSSGMERKFTPSLITI